MSLLNGKFIRNIFVQEQPTGTVNGVNDEFTLSHNPIFLSAHLLFLNGVLLAQGVHYILTGNEIKFSKPPAAGQVIMSVYIRSL